MGNGGDHRSYQIVWDIEQAVGRDHVTTISLQSWTEERLAGIPYSEGMRPSLTKRLKNRATRYAQNPFKVFAPTSFSTHGTLPNGFAEYYEVLLTRSDRPLVAVLENANLGELVDVNDRHDVPTIICPQSIESLDHSYPAFARSLCTPQSTQARISDRMRRHAIVTDFANEAKVMAHCAKRLCLSKVEAGLFGGIGLPSEYYPYLPVGAVRARMETIRQQRPVSRISSKLFLLLGSAEHSPTRESLRWFLRNAQTHGLPEGFQVVVGGSETRSLLPEWTSVPGLELRGWLPQEDLDDLLTHVRAVLIPQLVGLGALTRLSELACAGIPVIAHKHTTYALDPPPGMHVVEAEWDAWAIKMQELSEHCEDVNGQEYLAWERQQPTPLSSAIRQLLTSGASVA